MRPTRRWMVAGVAVGVVLVGVGLLPAGDGPQESSPAVRGPVMDLSGFSADPPREPLRLLFIHHSVGGQLMARPGIEAGEETYFSIYDSHPNGGDLRRRLTEVGYQVHEAAYHSAVGDRTDLFDWLPKFRDDLDAVLRADHQNAYYEDGRRNQIVMFKSCFPNSLFVGEGDAPGNPAGPELTVWNARASMEALLEPFARHPEVLFVFLTSPPNAPRPQAQPLFKYLAKWILGRPTKGDQLRASSDLARQFANWVRSPDGWLRDYPHRNVVVFDYYDLLTADDNLAAYATEDDYDSHPSAEGNRRAADALLPFLNRAVRRAGLTD